MVAAVRTRWFRLTVALALALALGSTLPSATTRASLAVCSGRFAVTQDASTLRLPICTSLSLTKTNSKVTRLVVVVHGDSRNAADHLRYTTSAASLAGVGGVLVVAPQFLVADDVTAAGLPSSVLYWTDGGWKQGDLSQSSPLARPFTISSFEVIDRLITSIATSGRFPNLRQVVVAGHSAGGQFADRYAGANRAEATIAARGMAMRYVVANPSSYVYWDTARWHADTGAFAPLTTAERSACPRFDDYKYGLNSLNTFVAGVGAATMKTQYGARTVVTLLGSLDADPTDPALDTSCQGRWQGAQRLDRGLRHHDYLGLVFGAGVYARHPVRIVDGVGHDARSMYASDSGRWALFGQMG